MPTTVDLDQILRLSVEERLRIVRVIWDSIPEDELPDEAFSLSEEQWAEMERRLDWAQKNPDECMTHEQFMAKLHTLK